LRGRRVTGLRQDPDSVELEVAGPEGLYGLRASYVVGCDGTRSTVRTSAGIDFPGTDATKWGWLGDVVLDDPPPNRLLSVNGLEGNLILIPLPGGLHRFCRR
jgi:2-polyprenyl-6-methoxyphenol hydroxylase-like FAD-dependent oxidoreductase